MRRGTKGSALEQGLLLHWQEPTAKRALLEGKNIFMFSASSCKQRKSKTQWNRVSRTRCTTSLRAQPSKPPAHPGHVPFHQAGSVKSHVSSYHRLRTTAHHSPVAPVTGSGQRCRSQHPQLCRGRPKLLPHAAGTDEKAAALTPGTTAAERLTEESNSSNSVFFKITSATNSVS